MGKILLQLDFPLQPFRHFESRQCSFNFYLQNFYLCIWFLVPSCSHVTCSIFLSFVLTLGSLTAPNNVHLAIDLCPLLFPRTLSQHKCSLIRVGTTFRDRALRSSFGVFLPPMWTAQTSSHSISRLSIFFWISNRTLCSTISSSSWFSLMMFHRFKRENSPSSVVH